MPEPINTRDMPGYVLDDVGAAATSIREVVLPNLKLPFWAPMVRTLPRGTGPVLKRRALPYRNI